MGSDAETRWMAKNASSNRLVRLGQDGRDHDEGFGSLGSASNPVAWRHNSIREVTNSSNNLLILVTIGSRH